MAMPSTFSQEQFDEVCNRIAEGRSLNAVCKDEGMPKKSVFLKWLSQNDSIRDQYMRARDVLLLIQGDELTDLSDDVDLDQLAIAKANLQINTRKWVLSKLVPKVYGDRLNLDGEVRNTNVTLSAAEYAAISKVEKASV